MEPASLFVYVGRTTAASHTGIRADNWSHFMTHQSFDPWPVTTHQSLSE